MTIFVKPQWDGIEIRRENDSIRSATLRYNIIGTTEATEADQALSQHCHSFILGNLYRTTSSIERLARRGFEGVVEYEYKNTDEFTFSFDTTGATQHITQSYQTLGGYAPPGYFPPNHFGAIGVNNRDIAGCDVIIPTLSFTMTRTKTGVLDLPFIRFVASLTGRINTLPFLIFQPGEVLFEGASGSQKIANSDSPAFDLSYKFRVSPNTEDLAVGNIWVGHKRGWDYFWVQYIEMEDQAANVIAKRPIAAFIERVYHEADLNLLLDPMIQQ